MSQVSEENEEYTIITLADLIGDESDGELECSSGTLVDIQASTADETRILYDRKAAAFQLSISIRTLDYLVANKKLATRRIGKKVLIPRTELTRFARSDHFGPVNVTPDDVN